MKTSELTGVALDRAVAKAMGWSDEGLQNFVDGDEYPEAAFSTDWALGGPIIEREKLELHIRNDLVDGWSAFADYQVYGVGSTPLIAAMRCFVASKLGDEVDIPKELT